MPRDSCDLQEKSLNIKKAKNKYSIRKVHFYNKIFEFIREFYEMNCDNLVVNEEWI